MKKNTIILFLIISLGFGCKSQKDINQLSINTESFKFFSVDTTFEIEIISFYQNQADCGTEGLPYSLLIGKTNNEMLPDTVSILSYCDNRTFTAGSNVEIQPTKNPTLDTTLNPIFIIKDTIIDNIKTRWIIGSEYQSIWGRPQKNK